MGEVPKKVCGLCRTGAFPFDALVRGKKSSHGRKIEDMRFLCIYKSSQPEGIGPTQEEMDRMGAFIRDSLQEGYLLSTEGCLPSVLGARVRMAEGKITVTDGPFAEAKEIVGGFALIQAKSKEEAIEYTKRFLKVAGDGETEIRQLYEAPAHETAKQ